MFAVLALLAEAAPPEEEAPPEDTLTPLKKKGERSPSKMWILQSTVFCKSQQFQNMPNFIDSAPFVE